MLFIDIALKAVGIQIIYAAIVVIIFTIADKKNKHKDQQEEWQMQNELTLCAILIVVMAFFMVLGMVGIRKEKREQKLEEQK